MLLTATITGEPMAMAGGGAITVSPLAASTFKVAGDVVVEPMPLLKAPGTRHRFANWLPLSRRCPRSLPKCR